MRVISFVLVAAVCLAEALPAQNGAAAAAPQLPPQASAPVPATGMQIPGPETPFSGSVPSGKATAETLPLSLTDAISRGLKYNLGVILNEQSQRLAQGERYVARSGLLPNITAGISDSALQLNLAAFGFTSFPGISTIVGPFNVFDARGFLSQQVFNRSILRNERAAFENEKASRFSYDNARDLVVLAVTSLYLQAVAGGSRVDAARAQFETAQALYNQAVDQKKAGVIPGIEVIRSQVEMQAQQQRLIFFQNESDKQNLALARAIGLPLEQKFRLTDHVPYSPSPKLTLEEAQQQAYQSRADYQNALSLVRAAEWSRKAAVAQYEPTVSLDANYGALGQRPWQSHGTFTVAGSVHMPVFQGGRIKGEVMQADALLTQRRSESEDLRGRIDYQIRTAFLDLKASGDQVEVARGALDLANQQMAQSRDRFAAGVTGSIEVVQAQEAVATANENFISSLYSYNLAKAGLARAIGLAEKFMTQFLEGTR